MEIRTHKIKLQGLALMLLGTAGSSNLDAASPRKDALRSNRDHERQAGRKSPAPSPTDKYIEPEGQGIARPGLTATERDRTGVEGATVTAEDKSRPMPDELNDAERTARMSDVNTGKRKSGNKRSDDATRSSRNGSRDTALSNAAGK